MLASDRTPDVRTEPCSKLAQRLPSQRQSIKSPEHGPNSHINLSSFTPTHLQKLARIYPPFYYPDTTLLDRYTTPPTMRRATVLILFLAIAGAHCSSTHGKYYNCDKELRVGLLFES